jgi:hypothetical protein
MANTTFSPPLASRDVFRIVVRGWSIGVCAIGVLGLLMAIPMALVAEGVSGLLRVLLGVVLVPVFAVFQGFVIGAVVWLGLAIKPIAKSELL